MRTYADWLVEYDAKQLSEWKERFFDRTCSVCGCKFTSITLEKIVGSNPTQPIMEQDMTFEDNDYDYYEGVFRRHKKSGHWEMWDKSLQSWQVCVHDDEIC